MVEGMGAMTDDRARQWELIEERVAHHQRALWREIQRWDDPPRVRVRKGRTGKRAYCRDIMIGDDGTVVWPAVDCDSE
jgi:hypothetical protein